MCFDLRPIRCPRQALPYRDPPPVGGEAMSAESVFDNLEAIRLSPTAHPY